MIRGAGGASTGFSPGSASSAALYPGGSGAFVSCTINDHYQHYHHRHHNHHHKHLFYHNHLYHHYLYHHHPHHSDHHTHTRLYGATELWYG